MATIRSYRSEDAVAFEALNLAWIAKYFSVEDEDRAQLRDPQASILDKGGRIFIAEQTGEVVGTIALLRGHVPGTLELVKMATAPSVQGQGIGRALLDAAIVAAYELEATSIWLETNSALEAALRLYRKVGFRELTGDDLRRTPYARCNCQMTLVLGNETRGY